MSDFLQKLASWNGPFSWVESNYLLGHPRAALNVSATIFGIQGQQGRFALLRRYPVLAAIGSGVGHRRRSSAASGVGMGLSVCRSIIDSHGGRLWVAPNKPDGAVFQFMLLADNANSAGASRREHLTASRPMRV